MNYFNPAGFLNLATYGNHLGLVKGTDPGPQSLSMELGSLRTEARKPSFKLALQVLLLLRIQGLGTPDFKKLSNQVVCM